MSKRALLTALAVASAVLAFSNAAAAQEVSLDSLEVVFWPEFDKPDVLVMYRATLSPDVPLPAVVSLPIPAMAGLPHAVAKRRGPQLFDAEYQTRDEGQWTHIDLLTDSPEIQLEYYAPLKWEANRRSYAFEWPGLIAVDELTFEAQEPVATTHFSVEPLQSKITTGGDGLDYYSGSLGARPVGVPASLLITYERDTKALSASPAPGRTSQPENAASAPTPMAPGQPSQPAALGPKGNPKQHPKSSKNYTNWLIALLVLVSVGGVTAFVVMDKKARREASKAKKG